MAELESLRSACASKIFDSIEGSSEERATEIIKRIQELTLRTKEQEEELALLTKDRDNLSKRVDYLNRDNADLEETLSDEKSSKESLSRDIDEKSTLLKGAMETIASLNHDIRNLNEELDKANTNIRSLESQLKIISKEKEATDAGDNTQILHMQMNPLQEAMDKLREEEDKDGNRKRKAEENESGDLADAKRSKNEQIDALENQLKRSQKEKDLAIRMQSEIAKKYREITTSLTGYQIKLKDVEEGICCVNSIYDDTEKQFVFKYYSDSGRVDLLDVGHNSPSDEQPWGKEMERYIGERQSIPAFLSAVTLQLESRRELVEELERTHTFSVLHQD